jgi:hypothetical protein
LLPLADKGKGSKQGKEAGFFQRERVLQVEGMLGVIVANKVVVKEQKQCCVFLLREVVGAKSEKR